tara:strand:- start:448 stop:1953 length:1506 start_codon:yes stop_codon:yes gene_type:complete
MNDMKLLMESWRKYSEVISSFEEKYALNSKELGTVYVLKENNQVEKTNMSLLVEQFKEGSINENRLSDILTESIEYEYQQLLNEGVLDTLKKVAGKVGDVVKPALAAAQFKARQALYKVIYGTASKILKFVSALCQKAMKYLGVYAKQTSQFSKKPPEPKLAQKLIARGVKIAKVVGSIFKKIVSFMLKVIKPIGQFLGHPVVKNTILIGCVLLAGVSIIAPGVIAGTSMAFLVPFATRKTGFETGKAALGVGKYDLNKDKVNEETQIAFGMTAEIQDMLSGLDQKEIGIAMDNIAEQIGSAKLDKSVALTTVQNVVTNPDGSEVVDFADKAWVQYSDENLKSQYAALDILKDTGQGGKPSIIFESANDLEKWQAQTEVIIKNAVKVAKDHCSSDPAACNGAEAFIEDINIANKATVKSEMLDYTKEVVNNAESKFESMQGQKTDVDQRFAVTRGGAEGEAEYYKSGKDTVAQKVGTAPDPEGADEKFKKVQSKVKGALNK